jgi:hypothetical protein
MGYKKAMKHDEHVILGKALTEAKRILREAHVAVANNIGNSHTASKSLVRARNNLDKACCALDSLYHSVTSDAQFEKHGHVYYGGRPNE